MLIAKITMESHTRLAIKRNLLGSIKDPTKTPHIDHMRLPEETEVYCFGDEIPRKTCRIRNMIYSVDDNTIIRLKKGKRKPFTFNFPKNYSHLMVWLNAASSSYRMDLRVESSEYFAKLMPQNLQRKGHLISAPTRQIGCGNKEAENILVFVQGPALVYRRFLPDNIMHAIHDDWLGHWSLMQRWPSLRGPSHWSVAIDPYPTVHFDPLAESIGGIPLRPSRLIEHRYWKPKKGDNRKKYICFDDAIVGNTYDLAWYQYGMGRPQGPLPAKPSGWRLRWAALQVAKHAASKVKRKPSPCIAIFSRTKNRLILNEEELGNALSNHFSLPICWIRQESSSLEDLIVTLGRAKMAFGMHGALLILVMFLPKNAIVIEGFPFAVDPIRFTPYRTLCGLAGMNLRYRAWVNKDVNKTIGHPERSKIDGGIIHLPLEEQQKIISATEIPTHHCCYNPYWMYKIYQDTLVDISAIISLFEDALQSKYQ